MEYSQERIFLEKIEIMKQVYGCESLQIALLCDKLGLFYRENGEYIKSKTMHENALSIKTKLYGPDHIEVVDTMYLLGVVYYYLNEYDNAKMILTLTVQKREQTLGKCHSKTVASLNFVACILLKQSEYAEANQILNDILTEINLENQITITQETIISLKCNLAKGYLSVCNYTYSKMLLDDILILSLEVLGKYHRTTAYIYYLLSLLFFKEKQFFVSVDHLESSLNIRSKLRISYSLDELIMIRNLAETYIKIGEFGMAEKVLGNCINGAKYDQWKGTTEWIHINSSLAKVFLLQDRLLLAKKYYQIAVMDNTDYDCDENDLLKGIRKKLRSVKFSITKNKIEKCAVISMQIEDAIKTIIRFPKKKFIINASREMNNDMNEASIKVVNGRNIMTFYGNDFNGVFKLSIIDKETNDIISSCNSRVQDGSLEFDIGKLILNKEFGLKLEEVNNEIIN